MAESKVHTVATADDALVHESPIVRALGRLWMTNINQVILEWIEAEEARDTPLNVIGHALASGLGNFVLNLSLMHEDHGKAAAAYIEIIQNQVDANIGRLRNG